VKPCAKHPESGRYATGHCIECQRDHYHNRLSGTQTRVPRLPELGVHCPSAPGHVFKKTVDPDEFYAKIESYRRKI
jgi:hypothetical protein